MISSVGTENRSRICLRSISALSQASAIFLVPHPNPTPFHDSLRSSQLYDKILQTEGVLRDMDEKRAEEG